MVLRFKLSKYIVFLLTFGIIYFTCGRQVFAQKFSPPVFFEFESPTPAPSETPSVTPSQAPKATPSVQPKPSPTPSATVSPKPEITPTVIVEKVTPTQTPDNSSNSTLDEQTVPVEPVQITPTTPPLYLTQAAQLSETPTPTPTKQQPKILKIVPIGNIEESLSGNFYANSSFSPLMTWVIIYISAMLFGTGVILVKGDEIQASFEKMRATLQARFRSAIHIG
jgi:hypothetical protein